MLSADFLTGSDGATISASDAGSADAWDLVTIDANASLTYSNERGLPSLPLAAKIVSSASPCTAIMEWSTQWGTKIDHYGRFYIYPETFWAVDYVMLLDGTTNFVGMTISGANYVTARDTAGTALFTCANPLALNQWNRVEWHIIHSTTTGFFEIKQFIGPDYNSSIPTDVQSASSANLNANSTAISFGLLNNDPGITARLAAIVAGASSYPGPSAATSNPRTDRIRSRRTSW